jgi:hypothetical protein
MRTHEPSIGSWRTAHPDDARRWLSDIAVPWWIAGGWALDLFLGTTSRAHKDLDVGIFRRDASSVMSSLKGWEIFEAKDRALSRVVAGAVPRVDVNSLWCRRADSTEWCFELLLDERTDDRWSFRRLPEITRPVAAILRHSADGLPYLSPEIQLLYKAKALRPEDQHDFDRVLPRLEAEAAEWLQGALELTHPEHPWIARLRESLLTRRR